MEKLTRRTTLGALSTAALASGAVVGCKSGKVAEPERLREAVSGDPSAILGVEKLPKSGPWPTPDPFLFCAHHDDNYPEGNDSFGPNASLDGRAIGQDFAGKDGFSMYHGRIVPGFPAHPHRGFETVTVVRKGLLDHADSLGAAARYGEGDVQWLTAGGGIQHAEMFPLLRKDEKNPLELFQIWLNLPKVSKMVAPHFKMMWASSIPSLETKDDSGRRVSLSIRAGKFGELTAPAPPPHSWAAKPENEVAIWTILLAPGARFAVPKASPGLSRSLYFFRGEELSVAGTRVPPRRAVAVRSDAEVTLENGEVESEILLLQGKPIGETVARRGPFVMNTNAEIRQAYEDYQATQFGGWPWASEAPVHGALPERFARRPDGSLEKPA